jgi:hypothetical protein
LAETIPQLKQYPEFSRIFDLVASQNPLQRKRIESFLRRQSEEYWIFAEGLSGTLNKALLQSENIRTEAARSYNRMCMDILREQIRFRKTGVYLISEAEAANQNVYSQPEVMRYYIVGLLLSYLFWPNHYQMWHFFTDHLSLMPAMANCLEVGAGHGLFTAETLRRFPGLEIHVLDISETSLNAKCSLLSRLIRTLFAFNWEIILKPPWMVNLILLLWAKYLSMSMTLLILCATLVSLSNQAAAFISPPA